MVIADALGSIEQPAVCSSTTMSKSPQESVAVSCQNISSANQSRPKVATISASGGDRQPVLPEGRDRTTDDAPTTGKRHPAYPVQRRGSRKKTLSLNPEEREALENLIEEVIMGGVGEGVIDSDASLSDDDDDDEDAEAAQSSSSAQDSTSGSSASATVDDSARQDVFVKGGKKFYPGQLKVALKHMHDLPPRFVRKLAKAQQYLDSGGSMYSKRVVSVASIEEEEETTGHSKDDSKQQKLAAASTAPVSNASSDRDRDRSRLKENKLKDAKKMIRTLLTDRDQYVDETVGTVVVNSQPHSSSSDVIFTETESVSGQQEPRHHQHDAAKQQVNSGNAVSACENMASFQSSITCSPNTQVYHPSAGSNIASKGAECVTKASDTGYRIGQSINPPTSGSRPIPAQPFQPPSLGIPQYQLSVPVVHGMKPAPVLSHSPPGTQFWIPQSVVPSNVAPGFYGSSPPVMDMTGMLGAYNQPIPYAYSVQSSFPPVQNVHPSYTPQYVYSASPPPPANQGLMGVHYSSATFGQPVSYPVNVLRSDHHMRPPAAVPANFYQNTPPPGYDPTQSHPVCDQRQMFSGDMPLPGDGIRKQMVSVDRTHSSGALVNSSHRLLPTQPVTCTGNTRCGHMVSVSPVSTGNVIPHGHEPCRNVHPRMIRPGAQHSHTAFHSAGTGPRTMPNVKSSTQRYSPDTTGALAHRTRLSKSPVSAPVSDPCSVQKCVSSPDSVSSPSTDSEPQTVETVQSEISEVGTLPLSFVDKTDIARSDKVLSHAESKPPKSPYTSPLPSLSSPVSGTSNASNTESAKSGYGGNSRETEAEPSGSCKTSEPCSAIPQESNTGNVIEFHSHSRHAVPSSMTVELAQPINNPHISDTAAAPSVNEYSGDVDVDSSDGKGVIRSTRLSHTGDISGEPVTGVEQNEVIGVGSSDDQFAPEVNFVSIDESSNVSSCDRSELQHSALSPVSDEAASDISLDCGATRDAKNNSSSDLAVTLSSSLVSALVEMFGPPPPPECDAEWGMQCKAMCLLMVIANVVRFCYLFAFRISTWFGLVSGRVNQPTKRHSSNFQEFQWGTMGALGLTHCEHGQIATS